MRDSLEVLIRHHLVGRTEHGAGAERLEMLAAVREYAAAQLHARGEGEATHQALAEHVVALAEQAAPALRGPHHREWIDRLDAERDNLAAVLTWATASDGDPASSRPRAALGVRLAAALWWFWFVRGNWGEGRHWLDQLLAGAAGIDAPLRVPLLYGGRLPRRPTPRWSAGWHRAS